ncbi:MAG: AraC family ligand binding domain-containing protein [Oscillospiraceae bacterium]|nr:AraC family ligand binding domain-containing protein [Candidatus Equicaccousia limihippi]
MKIEFTADIKGNFSHGHSVSGFVYNNYSIPFHTHNFYEINVVLSGSGTHCIENGKFTVSAGDVFVIPPYVAHAYKNTRNLDVYHLLIKPSFLADNRAESTEVKGFLEFTEIEPFLRGNFDNAMFLHLDRAEFKRFTLEREIIDDDGKYDWQTYHAMKYHAVLSLLYRFSGLLAAQFNSPGHRKEHKYESRILKTLETIHSRYPEKLSVEGLCGEVYLSRSTFLRAFKEICGTSPIDYLCRYRTSRAREMIAMGTGKTETAYACGFYDLSHLERALKKYPTVFYE